MLAATVIREAQQSLGIIATEREWRKTELENALRQWLRMLPFAARRRGPKPK
jgi:hypothetical protein